jgi:hypothetical protein
MNNKKHTYSNWYFTIQYINERKDEQWFSPLDIKSYCNYTNTINCYITYLHKYGYITRVDHGYYIKKINIPESLTITKLKDVIYNRDFERIRKLHQIKKRIVKNNI